MVSRPSHQTTAAQPPAKSHVSPARRRLIESMQELNFGQIERLHLRDGEPVFDPPPRVVQEIKFASENGPRREADADDFALKAQVVELFAHCDKVRDGIIESLVVKHGLPFLMSVESAA